MEEVERPMVLTVSIEGRSMSEEDLRARSGPFASEASRESES